MQVLSLSPFSRIRKLGRSVLVALKGTLGPYFVSIERMEREVLDWWLSLVWSSSSAEGRTAVPKV